MLLIDFCVLLPTKFIDGIAHMITAYTIKDTRETLDSIPPPLTVLSNSLGVRKNLLNMIFVVLLKHMGKQQLFSEVIIIVLEMLMAISLCGHY